MTETTRTDTDAAAELAAEASILPLDAGEHLGITLPPGWTFETLDTERQLLNPKRARGTILVHDADSFVAAVQHRQLPDIDPVVYSSEAGSTPSLVAVLDDDRGTLPGWREYAVSLDLRPTPEWRHWVDNDGSMVSQEAFAEHIEDGINELQEPAAADMLEIAQSFHATVNAGVKAGVRLASGQVQIRYEEEIDASAGTNGTLLIPQTLTLAIAPFVGAARYKMTARFRYRLNRGELRLGYKLDRPHEVLRAAFRDIKEAVVEGLPDAGFIGGPSPTATR